VGALPRDVAPHLLDHAVAVQVVDVVLVGDAVVVVVDRLAARAAARVDLQEVLAAIGVHRRHDVEHPLVDQLPDARQPIVVLHQVPDRVEADPALDLVAVDVGLDVTSRPWSPRRRSRD
jgi:hypothetical protein